MFCYWCQNIIRMREQCTFLWSIINCGWTNVGWYLITFSANVEWGASNESETTDGEGESTYKPFLYCLTRTCQPHFLVVFYVSFDRAFIWKTLYLFLFLYSFYLCCTDFIVSVCTIFFWTRDIFWPWERVQNLILLIFFD